MGHDLGVGLGFEAMAAPDQLFAQRLEVLDDAVVDQGHAVAGHLRMGVALAGLRRAWPSVYERSPLRPFSGWRSSAFRQPLYLTLGPVALDPALSVSTAIPAES